MALTPVTLDGRHVRLEPLGLIHAPGLLDQGREPEIWTHLFWPPLTSLAEAEAFIHWSLSSQNAGQELPFAIIDRASAQVAGTTRYMDIQEHHRGLEIGWTWLGRQFRRTALNTEAKLLLLTHAFESLNFVRVQLKTDHLNVRSQQAIERIGAKREGVLRSHRRRLDGSFRDTVLYSVIQSEWPDVRDRLERLLKANGQKP